MLLLHNASTLKRNVYEEIESDGTYSVDCNNCCAPISDYDEPFVREICEYAHEYVLKLCYECCATKQICHEKC